MHTQALPRQFQIVVNKDEIGIIAAALAYAAGSTNALWQKDTKDIALKLSQALNATTKQTTGA